MSITHCVRNSDWERIASLARKCKVEIALKGRTVYLSELSFEESSEHKAFEAKLYSRGLLCIPPHGWRKT